MLTVLLLSVLLSIIIMFLYIRKNDDLEKILKRTFRTLDPDLKFKLEKEYEKEIKTKYLLFNTLCLMWTLQIVISICLIMSS